MLGLYRALLAMRRAEPALHVGEHRTVGADADVLVYERSAGENRFVIALNLGAGAAEAALDGAAGEVALGTSVTRLDERVDGRVRLEGGEAVVVRRS